MLVEFEALAVKLGTYKDSQVLNQFVFMHTVAKLSSANLGGIKVALA